MDDWFEKFRYVATNNGQDQWNVADAASGVICVCTRLEDAERIIQILRERDWLLIGAKRPETMDHSGISPVVPLHLPMDDLKRIVASD